MSCEREITNSICSEITNEKLCSQNSELQESVMLNIILIMLFQITHMHTYFAFNDT